MLPALYSLSFMAAPTPEGWVQHGDRWGLWWGNRELAHVQPDARGVRVVLACRKLWQNKEVRAASVGQGKRYAERWCAARVLEGVPLKMAVARLVGERVRAEEPKLTPAEIQQRRRLRAALPPLIIPGSGPENRS